MFDLLQHPPRSPERAPLGAGISVAVHVTLVLALLGSGVSSSMEPSLRTTESVIESALRYLLPPDRPGTSEVVQAKWSAKQAGVPKPSDPSVFSEREPVPVGTPTPDREDSSVPQTLQEAAAEQNAFTLLDVDTVAVRDPASAVPIYPRLLELRGIEGTAVVRFVVDTNGRADLATFRLMETNHPMFGNAVREALPRMKFRPATVGANKVRQLVEVPFGFQLVRRADGSRRPND